MPRAPLAASGPSALPDPATSASPNPRTSAAPDPATCPGPRATSPLLPACGPHAAVLPAAIAAPAPEPRPAPRAAWPLLLACAPADALPPSSSSSSPSATVALLNNALGSEVPGRARRRRNTQGRHLAASPLSVCVSAGMPQFPGNATWRHCNSCPVYVVSDQPCYMFFGRSHQQPGHAEERASKSRHGWCTSLDCVCQCMSGLWQDHSKMREARRADGNSDVGVCGWRALHGLYALHMS